MALPDGQTLVLVVEDERDLADLFTEWLEAQYSVRTAYTGEGAAEAMDHDIDMILLDRRLPGISGDEFLEQAREAGFDAPVVVVSAVEPDFDILEMGFSDYLVKPVEKAELLQTVERVLSLDAVEQASRDYFSLLAKKDTLEAEKTEMELQSNEQYSDLLAELERFRRSVISLAEDCLETATSGSKEAMSDADAAAFEKWEERKSELEEGDPLYRLAEEKIREFEAAAGGHDDDSDPESEFLEVIAESFVAEGFWLDSRVLRALNLVFYEKHDEVFVIDGTRLAEHMELTTTEKFELSQAVREQADWLM